MIKQGARMFDELIVAIGDVRTSTTFPMGAHDRTAGSAFRHTGRTHCRVPQPLWWTANEHGATFHAARHPFRRIMNMNVMRHINADMAHKVCTVFLMPPRDTAELSSSMIKGLIGPEGGKQVSRYVHHNMIRHAEGEVPGFPAFLAAFWSDYSFVRRGGGLERLRLLVLLPAHTLDEQALAAHQPGLHLFHRVAQFPARQKAVELAGPVHVAFDGDSRGGWQIAWLVYSPSGRRAHFRGQSTLQILYLSVRN